MSQQTEHQTNRVITDEMLAERIAASDRARKEWKGSRGHVQTVLGIVLLIAGCAALLVSFMASFLPWLPAAAVCLAIGVLCVVKSPAKPEGFLTVPDFRKLLDRGLIPSVLESVFDRVDDFCPEEGLPEDKIRLAGLTDWDRCFGSDRITAVYKGKPLELCDLGLDKEDQNTDEDETRYVPVFKGFCMICGTDRTLSADLEIADVNAEGGSRETSVVEMDSAAFNNRFTVSCTDRHQVFYLLTPVFQEKITALAGRAGGAVRLKFLQDGRLCISVSTGRDMLFHAGDLHETPAQLRERFTRELNSILELADELRG